MDAVRKRRQEEIRQALTFIQSPLAYPDPDGYQDFLTGLVRNLLAEGQCFLGDGAAEDAVREFSEGLNVASYAEATDVSIPAPLKESLYVNRAAALHQLGDYPSSVSDCDAALLEVEGSSSALYRKAQSLKELRRFREAYSCLTDASLMTPPMDPDVSSLAQELSVHLGLKLRKPYVSNKVSSEASTNVLQSVSSLPPSLPSSSSLPPSLPPSSSLPPSLPSSFSSSPEDSELMGDDLDSILDCLSTNQDPPQASLSLPISSSAPPGFAQVGSALFCRPIGYSGLLTNGFDPSRPSMVSPAPSGPSLVGPAPSMLPAPTPRLPPAFFTSAVRHLNTLDSFCDTGPTPSSPGPTSSSPSPAPSCPDPIPSSLGSAHCSQGPAPSSVAALDVLDDLIGPGPGGPAPSMAGLDSLDTLDDILEPIRLRPEAVMGAEPLDALDDISEPIRSGGGLTRGAETLDALDDIVEPIRSGAVKAKRAEPLNQLDQLDLVEPGPVLVPEPPGSLDTLDAFTPLDGTLRGRSLDSLSQFRGDGVSDEAPPPLPSSQLVRPLAAVTPSSKPQRRVIKDEGGYCVSNPLFNTHDFQQACTSCFPSQGPGPGVYKAGLSHGCRGDVLLSRRKTSPPSSWSRIRPVPPNTFTGPFILCREIQSSGSCKFGERCTFAYNQLEVEVWTEERKGRLDRSLLFHSDSAHSDPAHLDPVSSIRRLLQENKGRFIFLCEDCYDNKPRIISKRCSENQTVCSNQDVHHSFDANKCLVFVQRPGVVVYHKVRPLGILSSLDLCRQVFGVGCNKDDRCIFAHSVIELKTWRVQTHTGISHDEIVKVSDQFLDELNSSRLRTNRQTGGENRLKGGGAGGAEGGEAAEGGVKTLPLKMKFCCSPCWTDGLISEPNKQLQFCSSRRRHAWTKERRVLLVRSVERSKWVQVRPLPHAKNPPYQYELCAQIVRKKRCTFIGNCSFAHSPEEREMWTYMKNNNMMDMQQMYDMWLKLTFAAKPRPSEEAPPPSEEKAIAMPTDYAEPMSGFYCRLCGRHSNGERQWQQHISSERHKDRVFSGEGDQQEALWSYRFPGASMTLCPRGEAGCPDGVGCDSAHSEAELAEWAERRNFLRQKLARAREDMLIMPDDFDFGKYNFLLRD